MEATFYVKQGERNKNTLLFACILINKLWKAAENTSLCGGSLVGNGKVEDDDKREAFHCNCLLLNSASVTPIQKF